MASSEPEAVVVVVMMRCLRGWCLTRGFEPELPMRVTLALRSHRD